MTRRTCCLLAVLLCAATAHAQDEATDETVRLGAEVGIAYSQKPEFAATEGDGSAVTYSGVVTANVRDQVSVSMTLEAQSVDEPERESAVLDPRLGLAYLPNLLGEARLKLSPRVRFGLGMSEESRAAGYVGNVRPSLGLSTDVGPLKVTMMGSFTKHIRRYTLAADGSPNVSHTLSGGLSLGLDLTKSLSLSASVERRRSVRYAGDPSHSFANSASLDYQATEHLGLGVGISTTDSQLDAAGRANNEFDLYRQNQTEIEISASYAL